MSPKSTTVPQDREILSGSACSLQFLPKRSHGVPRASPMEQSGIAGQRLSRSSSPSWHSCASSCSEHREGQRAQPTSPTSRRAGQLGDRRARAYRKRRNRGDTSIMEIMEAAGLRLAATWKRFAYSILAYQVDRALTEAYCCLTSWLRRGQASLLPAHRQWRIARQRVVIAARLEVEHFPEHDEPPYQRHLSSLARLRRVNVWQRAER